MPQFSHHYSLLQRGSWHIVSVGPSPMTKRGCAFISTAACPGTLQNSCCTTNTSTRGPPVSPMINPRMVGPPLRCTLINGVNLVNQPPMEGSWTMALTGQHGYAGPGTPTACLARAHTSSIAEYAHPADGEDEQSPS